MMNRLTIGILSVFITLTTAQLAFANPIDDFYGKVNEKIQSGTEEYLDEIQQNITEQIHKAVNSVNSVENFYNNIEKEINCGTAEFIEKVKVC